MKLQEANDEAMKVTQFLMGLTDTFTNIRGQLLMMTPLPTLSQALALLQQEEKQRNFGSQISVVPESATLMSRFSNNNYQNFGTTGKFNKTFSGNKKADFKGGKKGNLECTCCHGTNHTRDKCFHLNEFPNKNKKAQGFPEVKTVAQVMHQSPESQSSNISMQSGGNSFDYSNTSSSGEMSGTNTCGTISGANQYGNLAENLIASSNFTPAQYQLLMALLSQGMTTSSTPGATSSSYSNLTRSGTTDFSGINTVCLSAFTCFTNWIIGSGATDHITSSYELLDNSVSVNSTIFLPNGQTSFVTHKGNVKLTSDITLQDVLCVPTFKFHLISVSKLARDTQWCISFLSNVCIFQYLVMKKVKGIGRVQENLYKLVLPATQSAVLSSQLISPAQLWHNRLGHSPLSVIRTIDELAITSCVPSFHCDVCPLAKQVRLPFPTSHSVSKNKFELIHCDLWCPYKHKTYNSCAYFLTIVDDYSKCTWTYLIKSKDQVPSIFQSFFAYVKNQFGCTVKGMRSDNGTEFFNSSLYPLLTVLGIVHQSSCVETPQQNGVVERKHKHLIEVARALRFKAHHPIQFWGDRILTATYLINRMPTAVLKNKTPYEKVFHKTTPFSHLKVFGCLCYASTLAHNRDKFSPRAIKCIFLGYPFGQKGYKLFDLTTKRIFVSRNVVFHEDIFHYHTETSQLSSVPSLHSGLSFIDDLDFTPSHKIG